MNWYERRWVLMLIFIAVVEIPLAGWKWWFDSQFEKPSVYPGDHAIYRSLAHQPSAHGRIAQWANQFMEATDALEILAREGYRCEPATPTILCQKDWTWRGQPRVDLDVRNRHLAKARGYYFVAGYRGWTYGEISAPGYEFAEPSAWLRFIVERMRVRERGAPATADYSKPVSVFGYNRMLEEMRALGMECEPAPDTPDVRCRTASLGGQPQAVVIRMSEADSSPSRIEADLRGAIAAADIVAAPDRTGDGHDLVMVREPGGRYHAFAIVERPEMNDFAGKFAQRFAALDAPSKARVLRVIAREIDEAFAADEDGALRPALQQVDYGALYVRRAGDLRGIGEAARGASLKAYASFALAECDRLAPAAARACFDGYAQARPELRAFMAEAIREVRGAQPSPERASPVARRLAALQAFESP